MANQSRPSLTSTVMCDIDRSLAIVLAAAIGGLTGLFATAINSFVMLKLRDKELRSALFKDMTSTLLGRRISAYETIWIFLSRDTIDNLSDAEWRSYISASLWLPPRLRTACVEIFTADEKPSLDRARAALLDCIADLEKGHAT